MNATGGHHVGEVIAGRVLTSYVGKNSFGHHLWRWTCGGCAEEFGPSTVSHLKRGRHCRECVKLRENNSRWLGYEQISGSFLYQYRSDAVKKGRAWAVTPEQLWSKWLAQGGFCVYTGWPLKHGETASLDRIDSGQGYTPDNVQWVHREINQMKSDRSAARFKDLCRAVAEHSTLKV